MPWVDEWYRDSTGMHVRQYYVPPPNGQRGGDDYLRKVTIHTDRSGVSTAQASEGTGVSMNEGKAIAKELTNKNSLKTITQKIEMIPTGAGVGATKTTTTITNPNTGEQTTTIQTETPKIINTETGKPITSQVKPTIKVIKVNENKPNNSISADEYNKLKQIEKENNQASEKEINNISKYDPGYTYERPLTKESLAKRNKAALILRQAIKEKYQAKSLMQQYGVLGDDRFYIDIGEGENKKRLRGKEAYNWLNNYKKNIEDIEFNSLKDYTAKGEMQGNFFQRIHDSAMNEFNKQLDRWSEHQATDEPGKSIIKPNTLSYIMAGGAYIGEAIGSFGEETFKDIAKTSFKAGVKVKGIINGWTPEYSEQVANKLLNKEKNKQDINMAGQTGRIAVSIAPYFMTGGVGTAKAVVDTLSSKSSSQIITNAASGVVFGAGMKAGKVFGEYAAMVARGTKLSVAGKAVKAGLWTAEHALPVYMGGVTAYSGYQSVKLAKDNPKMAKEMSREMNRQFGSMTLGSKAGGYVTHKALSSVRLATLKGNIQKNLIERGATSEELKTFSNQWEATYGKQSKLLKKAKPIEFDFSKPEALEGDAKAQNIVKKWYQKHRQALGIYGSGAQQAYEGIPKRIIGDIDTSVKIPHTQQFFAKSLGKTLKKAGYKVNVWKSPKETHPGTWEVSITKKGKSYHLASFSNPGQSGLYGSMHEMLGGFEFPHFQWETTKNGLSVLNLRTQARLKLSGAYGVLGNTRVKDMADLTAIAKTAQQWSVNHQSPNKLSLVGHGSDFSFSTTPEVYSDHTYYSQTNKLINYAFSNPKPAYTPSKYSTPKINAPYPEQPQPYAIKYDYSEKVKQQYPKESKKYYPSPKETYPAYPQPRQPYKPVKNNYPKPLRQPYTVKYDYRPPIKPGYPSYPRNNYPTPTKQPSYPKYLNYPAVKPPIKPPTPLPLTDLSPEKQERMIEEVFKTQQRVQSSLSARIFNIRGKMPKQITPFKQRPLPIKTKQSRITKAIKKIIGL